MRQQLRLLGIVPSKMRPGEICVDLFAGGGGFSEGFQWATGVPPAIAVNHDADAIAMHIANHPETEHHHEDVFHVDPLEATRGRAVGWLHLSPDCRHFSRAKGSTPNTARALSKKIRGLAWVGVRWAAKVKPRIISLENVSEFCFPEDTAVLSKRGMVPIGDLRIGDEVWTHNARWKPVTRISRRTSETVAITGYANSIVETTPNHQFYARQYAPKITKSGKFGRHEARLLEPEWVRADRLAEKDESSEYTRTYSGYAWASPLEMPRYWMRLPGELGVDTSSPAFFYMIGRWVGDGWIKKRKERRDQNLIRICANLHEADELEERLASTGLSWHRSNHTATVDVFDLKVESSRVLIPWLRRHFGEYADRKTVPAWLFGASEAQRWAFIEGHCDSDGHEQESGAVALVSVSRCLAVGVRLLLHSLGVVAAISKVDARTVPAIDRPEKMMSCRAAYTVSWRRETEWEKGRRTELHIWGRVRSVSPARSEVEVVDIEVADDHSFVADGQVVHNCTWSPLHQQGRSTGTPVVRRKGETFRKFISALETLGYEVQWRELKACDFGAPTSRKRLFLIARRDGQPIVWPKPTHGPKGSKPYRTAAECIDWSIPVPSIFDRKKPLAEATLRRIAEGIKRYVLEAKRPFLVNLTHGGRLEPIDEPFSTITAAHRGEKAVVSPIITKAHSHGWDRGAGPSYPADRPLGTIVSKDGTAVIAPTLIQTGYGERKGQKPRTLDLEAPLGSIVAGGGKHALVAAFISKFYTGVVGHPPDRPLGTVTAWDHHAVVAATLMSNNTNNAPHSLEDPLGTITSGNRHYEVAVFMAKYYGADKHGQALDEPLHTVPTKDRFGLVTVTIDGETFVIVDIGMRMLAPRELARAQGFPDSYILTGTKTSQTARIGNSVPPHFPAAIVAANLNDDATEERAA